MAVVLNRTSPWICIIWWHCWWAHGGLCQVQKGEAFISWQGTEETVKKYLRPPSPPEIFRFLTHPIRCCHFFMSGSAMHSHQTIKRHWYVLFFFFPPPYRLHSCLLSSYSARHSSDVAGAKAVGWLPLSLSLSLMGNCCSCSGLSAKFWHYW